MGNAEVVTRGPEKAFAPLLRVGQRGEVVGANGRTRTGTMLLTGT